MKKFIFIILGMLLLASCENSMKIGTESGATNSGTIISTGGLTASGVESSTGGLAEIQEIIAEKSYFYTNPTDTEPRKAYVMKGDTIKIDTSKSTDTMIFATYISSSGTKTEGYLKKSDISNKTKNTANANEAEDSITKTSNCKRIYDFSIGENQNIKGHRHFEFNFIGDCAEQKGTIEIGALHLNQEGIKVKTGQKGYFMNWMHTFDTGFPGWCGVINPDMAESFLKGNFFISIKAGKNYCTTMDSGYEDQNTYGIGIEISEKGKGKLFDITFNEMPKNVLEQNYGDLLWTLKNGFFEVGKSRNDAIVPSEKWTKEMLGEGEVSEYSDYIRFKDFTISTGVDTTTGPDCENRTATRDTNMCEVEDIKNGFVYWSQYFRSYITYENYERESTSETKYKTSINTGKTEKINTEDKETCWGEGGMAEGKEIPCKD